ncbi:methyltransferase domain-containing protein [Streptomyces sp. NPDC051132]|uniref:methyltransferase domain-containing protein n=1 Tax=unclassified Streptomyces TaxID=2593676 RepID=UPI0034364B66
MASGALSSDWAPSFSAVDRAAFLPELMWPYDMSRRASVCVDKRADPVAWYAAADSDAPIITQWDDGAHSGPAPGKLSTSSSSMPSTVFSLLQDLDVEAGMRVLDVGTGTGETAALLSHRLGVRNVTTVEVDEAVARRARDHLLELGWNPETVVGDGFDGYPGSAPYDRVLATVGIRQLPLEWVRQTRSGGVILAPWGTSYGNADAMVRLRVKGETATGSFSRLVEFMKLRAHRGPALRPADYLSAGPV